MIKNIVFDFDGVICDWEYWYKCKLILACKYAERHLGLKGFHDTFWKYFDKKSIFYKYCFRDTLARLGYNLDLESIIYSKMTKFHVDEIVFEGLYEFLEEIKDKTFTIFTNGYRDTHESRIKHLKLDIYKTIYAGGTKHPKPSGHYLDMLNFKPSETIMIGDYIQDVIYAKHAGYHTLVFRNDIAGYTRVDNYNDILTYINTYDRISKC